MASSMDKLAKELKKQMTASDERKPKPYDTQAEVLRVENGIAWVHIPGGVDETPVRLTINAKKGDNVNLHVANGTAWITGNSTNPPTDDSTANYAVNISNEVKKDITVLNTVVAENIEATNARFINVEADTAKIHALTAEKILATVGYIDDLTADNITAEDISASSGYIKDLEADNITAQDISAATGYIGDLTAGNVTAQNVIADHATVGSLDTNYAHITNGVIDNAKIGYADVDGLNANYAHISNGTIDNAKIDQADVNNLNANYAQINLANVNNAWIENGLIKDAAISDAQILGVSANKLTAGTIDASNITVTNLNASNITTGSITVDGITIDVENNEASIDGEYIEDGTITLNGLAQEVTDKIDGAIETFTGSAVPTLNNYPASSWTTTKIKDSHIGDVYYVLNTENTADGYCYRFAKDGNTYKWILIKDSDVTAALSRLTTAEGKISGLESFESTTSSWITNTDEELGSIKSNHTSLVTVVDKTVKETVQLWFTKANTTAPSKPTAQVTNNSPTGSNSYNKWNLAVPQYNSSYPNYYYCYQWKYVDGTYGWSAVTRDIAMGESQSTARTAASDASTAVSTAETASTNASNAVSTANTASTNASTALSTASTANTNASTALSTANTAASDASSAVSTANTANSNASSAVTTANAAQTTANANIKSSVQLWFTKANTTAPSKPTAHVTTNDASKANQWNIAVPTYNGTYPNYFYCYEYQKGDGTYAWSNVVYDRATTENQSNSRSALSQVATKVETSTFNTLSQTVDSNTANITSLSNVVETKADSSTVTTLSNTVNEVSQTATGNSSKISSLTNTLGTNADGTTKAGDIVHRTSAVEQDLSGFKTTVSKTYHKTSDFNTYKAANDTAVAAAKKAGDDAQADLDEYKGTVSETYATKSSLTQTAEGIRTDVSSTYETKTDASAKLTEAKGDATTKANKALTDAKADTTNKLKSYYTKTETDSAITQKAGEISLSVAQTEISKIEVGGRNLWAYGSDCQNSLDGLNNYQNGFSIVTEDGYKCAHASGALKTTKYLQSKIGYVPKPSETFTYSCYVKIKNIVRGTTNPMCEFYFSVQTIDGSWKGIYTYKVYLDGELQTGVYGFDRQISDTKWHHFAVVGTYANANFTATFLPSVYFRDCTGDLYVRNLKAERGNKATDWTPAPEEVEKYTDNAVSAAKAEIKVTTDGISTEVAKKTDKETIISTIRQSAESVKIKASQVEINGTATFNAIKSSTDAAYDAKGAAQSAVDGIEVGGRNIMASTTQKAMYKCTVTAYDKSYNGVTVTTTENGGTLRFLHVIDESNIPYTITFVCTSSVATSVFIDAMDNTIQTFPIIAGTTKVVCTTIPTRAVNSTYHFIDVGFNAIGTYKLANIKIEKGNKATDWTPAPEDVQAEIDAVSDAVDDKADKTAAVAEEQLIYISKASGTTSVSGTTTWITETGNKQNTWTTKRPTYNSSYPVLFVAKQKKVVSGTVTCTTPVKDDTTTVIDGGHITTGTIDSNRLNADTIKVNAANIQGSLTIGQLPSTVAETSDIPTKVSELSNDSGYQTSSQVSSAINNVRSWYATCSTAAGTAAKVATITPTTTAFTTSVLTAGTLVNVKFTVTNTAAVADLTLNINNTGAKHIKTLRYGVINNIAGAGYLAKDTTYQFTYDGTYWVMQENYNSDTQNRIRWQNVIAAAEAITSGHIICGTASGYRNIAANVSFDMAYPLLYAATAIAKGATSGTRDNNFLEINGINASSNGTITSGAANKVLYLKGTISGNTFTISASPFMTTAVPSSQDNICYIPIGIMYSATNIYFKSSDQIYAYKDGAFGQISLREASAAAKTATTYITHIDNNGIRVHPSSTQNNSVVINAKGMEVFKGGTDDEYSVAKYGDTARIGKESGSHLTLAPDSMSMSDGTKDVFNLLQKTMYIYWNRNYKGRQFANSTDRHVDSWETNTTISTWDSIAVNYKLNNTSRTKKITSISNGVLVNDEIYVHFNYSGTKITLTYGRGSSAASSDIIKLESAVVYYVTDEKLSQLHTGTYPNTTVSGALRIGNGTSDSNRRNLMLVDWSGTGKFKGDILAFCGPDSSGGMSLTKAEENIDAFKYKDANGHVYINAYRVGRIVSLLCSVSKTPSIAPGANLYLLDLTNAHLPKPLGTNTSGTGIYSSNMIIGNIYYNKTVTPNRYEFICRNGGSTAVQMGTSGVGFTITYICQMDEVSGEIKYMDD